MRGFEPSLLSRFLILRALRWLPAGLMAPVLVLFGIDQGFTAGQFVMAAAAQSVTLMLLELPTGGLADVIGPRRVLLMAGLADLVSIGTLLFATSIAVLVVVFAIQGVYRALESGPLEAWYVSTAVALDPGHDIEADLAKGGTVLWLSIAAGSVLSSALVWLAPSLGVRSLLLPLVVGLAIRVVDMAAMATLITEQATPSAGPDQPVPTVGGSLRQVFAMMAGASRMILGSVALAGLLGVEFLWGFGMVGFELFFPARLSEVVADADRAALILGPLGTVAFLASAAGSAVVPRLSRRIGAPMTGAVLRVAQGIAVLGLAAFAGPIGLALAYLVTMSIHGAANTVHAGVLHGLSDSEHRTTLLSANSLAAGFGGGLGAIMLGLLAAGGLQTVFVISAVVLAIAAPLYLIGERQPRPAIVTGS